jgi:hypothetical protein
MGHRYIDRAETVVIPHALGRNLRFVEGEVRSLVANG